MLQHGRDRFDFYYLTDKIRNFNPRISWITESVVQRGVAPSHRLARLLFPLTPGLLCQLTCHATCPILEDPRATSATTLPSPGSGLAAPLPHASSLIPALPASRAWPHDHLGPRTRATWTVPASRLASLTLAPFSRRRYRECRCFTSLHFLALHPPALHHACSRHTLAPSCAAVSASQPPSCSAD